MTLWLFLFIVVSGASADVYCGVTQESGTAVSLDNCPEYTLVLHDQEPEVRTDSLIQFEDTVGCIAFAIGYEGEYDVYKLCGQALELQVCATDHLFVDPLDDARACIRDVGLWCDQDCCAEECCFEKQTDVVSTWADHSWDDFLGSDGIALLEVSPDDDGPSSGRIRVDSNRLILTCTLPDYQGRSSLCYGSNNITAERHFHVPDCSPTTATVTVSVISAPLGTYASLGEGPMRQLIAGPNVFIGTAGPLRIIMANMTCDESALIENIEVDTICARKIDAPIECPLESTLPNTPTHAHHNTRG